MQGRLVSRIVNNLQVSIENVHLRYEDSASVDHPFHCGLTIERLMMNSAGADWNVAPMSEAGAVSRCHSSHHRKLVDLQNLAVYWSSGDLSTSGLLSRVGQGQARLLCDTIYTVAWADFRRPANGSQTFPTSSSQCTPGSS